MKRQKKARKARKVKFRQRSILNLLLKEYQFNQKIHYFYKRFISDFMLGGPKNEGASVSKQEKNFKLLIFKVWCDSGAGMGAVAQGPTGGKLRKGRDLFLVFVKSDVKTNEHI